MKQQEPSGHHEKLPPTFAEFLVSKRKKFGLNRTDMARKLKISRTQLTRLETGEHKKPSLTLLICILNLKEFEVSPEDLYALTGHIVPAGLPAFVPYLRAIHPDWPSDAIVALDSFHDRLSRKYSAR